MDTWQGFSDVELQRLKRGASQRTGDRAGRTDSGDSPALGRRGDDHAQRSNRFPSQRSSQRAEGPRSLLDEEAENEPSPKGTDECSKPHKKDAPLDQVKTVSTSSTEQADCLPKPQEATSAIDANKEERISFDWCETHPILFRSFFSLLKLACLLNSACFDQSGIEPGGFATQTT